MMDWRDIVDRHGPIVWRTAYRLLNDHADAADCFQETFVAVVKLARRQQVHNWPALLKTVAASRAIDRLKQRSRQRKRSAGPDDLTFVPTHQPGPVQDAEAAELMEQVRRALRRVQNRARYCFETALNRNPNLDGKVVTRFVIDGTGRARRIYVERSTLRDRMAEACLVRMIEQTQFPACEGGEADVRYPWIFKSGG